MKAYIQSLGTANPSFYLTQKEVLGVLESHFQLEEEEAVLYRRILNNGSIRGRYFGMESPAAVLEEDQDRLVARFLEQGRTIAVEAGRVALAEAGIEPGEVGGLVVNTCTGYLCPGLTSYVAEELGLDPYVRVLDIMGMGCGAALPNLNTASALVHECAGQAVLSLAVEICSATIFMGNDPGLVVSNCIFGDGAAAAVLTGREHGHRGVRFIDFESGLFPNYRSQLHYRTEDHRLRNVLDRRVPVIGARATEKVARRLLERHGLKTGDIGWWAVHPGGTEVLDGVARHLDLGPDQLEFSRAVFSEFGNMSSPSVWFVLKKIMEQAEPKRGERGLMLAFGAGFSAFAALLEF